MRRRPVHRTRQPRGRLQSRIHQPQDLTRVGVHQEPRIRQRPIHTRKHSPDPGNAQIIRHTRIQPAPTDTLGMSCAGAAHYV